MPRLGIEGQGISCPVGALLKNQPIFTLGGGILLICGSYFLNKTFKYRKFILYYNRKMELLKLNSKGQIVIPQGMRKDLGMQEGSVIGIEKVDKMVVVKKVDDVLVNKIKRSLEDIKHGRIKEWKG